MKKIIEIEKYIEDNNICYYADLVENFMGKRKDYYNLVSERYVYFNAFLDSLRRVKSCLNAEIKNEDTLDCATDTTPRIRNKGTFDSIMKLVYNDGVTELCELSKRIRDDHPEWHTYLVNNVFSIECLLESIRRKRNKVS